MHLALLGTGLMGQSMAERLIETGHRVTVYNRTRAKAERLTASGAVVATRPEDAVAATSCILLMLADARAIKQVLLSRAVRPRLAGRTVIQLGTIGPRESQALQRSLAAAGSEYLEAPVLGSKGEARGGTLQIMVGGSPEQFDRWAGLLGVLGEPRLIGSVGQAAALKLALNHLIATEISALALSVGFLQREGVPVERFMEVLRKSALYAPTFDKKLPRMLRREFDNPNFPVRHLLKDVTLFLQEARRLRLDTSSLNGVPRLLKQTIRRGWGDLDYSALFNTVHSPRRPPRRTPGPRPAR